MYICIIYMNIHMEIHGMHHLLQSNKIKIVSLVSLSARGNDIPRPILGPKLGQVLL